MRYLVYFWNILHGLSFAGKWNNCLHCWDLTEVRFNQTDTNWYKLIQTEKRKILKLPIVLLCAAYSLGRTYGLHQEKNVYLFVFLNHKQPKKKWFPIISNRITNSDYISIWFWENWRMFLFLWRWACSVITNKIFIEVESHSN